MISFAVSLQTLSQTLIILAAPSVIAKGHENNPDDEEKRYSFAI